MPNPDCWFPKWHIQNFHASPDAPQRMRDCSENKLGARASGPPEAMRAGGPHMEFIHLHPAPEAPREQ
jgi:hypothetical protein